MAQWRGGFSVDSDEEAANDGEGEDGAGGGLHTGGATRDGLIVLIDCREPMLSRLNGEGQPLVRLAFKIAKKVLKQKALASDRDLAGVVLFGCGKATSAEMPSVLVLQPLEQPWADRIKQLTRLSKMDATGLAGEIGASTAQVSLSDAVWTCQSQFSACPLRLGFRRIFLLTNDDSPHEGDQHKRAQLRTKIRDLQQTDIELLLVPQLPTPAGGNLFDSRRFYYDNLLPEDDRIGDGSDRLEDLLQSVVGKASARRAQVRLGWRLGTGMSLPVGVYNLTRRCAVPPAERLHRATNERVKQTTRKYLAETAEVLMPTDLKKAVAVAGKKVLFEMEEVKRIRHLSQTGLSLLAFYPLAALKNHHHVRSASFVYPDEAGAQGAVCLFSGLLRACLNKQRFALCAYTPRANAATSLAALVPQAEVRDPDTGAQIVPPGFHLVQLPFADDCRKLTLEDASETVLGEDRDTHGATEAQVVAAKALTQRLTVPNWSPENHANPALQTYQALLEAIALDKAEPRKVEDTTLLGAKALARAEKVVDQFVEACGLRKRSDGGGGGGGAAKRAKGPGADTPLDVEAEARAGQLSKLTVPVLKEAAAKLRLKPASQRKQDLVDAISAHFGL